MVFATFCSSAVSRSRLAVNVSAIRNSIRQSRELRPGAVTRGVVITFLGVATE